MNSLLLGSDFPSDEPRIAVEAVASLGFAEPELRSECFGNASERFRLTPADPVAPLDGR